MKIRTLFLFYEVYLIFLNLNCSFQICDKKRQSMELKRLSFSMSTKLLENGEINRNLNFPIRFFSSLFSFHDHAYEIQTKIWTPTFCYTSNLETIFRLVSQYFGKSCYFVFLCWIDRLCAISSSILPHVRH